VTYAGRRDGQVKVHGLRVELADVELELRQHPGVRDAVAAVVAAADGREPELVAGVVPRSGPVPDGELRAHLRGRLPAPMVPARTFALDRVPLTPNGKPDRAAVAAASPGPGGAAVAAAPRGPLEPLIADVWREVLGLPAVDVERNFFDAGGSSLAMARIHARLQRSLARELSIVDLFRFPTVRSLAAYLAAPAAPDLAAAARRGRARLDRRRGVTQT
jgi:hypothetical protein